MSKIRTCLAMSGVTQPLRSALGRTKVRLKYILLSLCVALTALSGCSPKDGDDASGKKTPAPPAGSVGRLVPQPETPAVGATLNRPQSETKPSDVASKSRMVIFVHGLGSSTATCWGPAGSNWVDTVKNDPAFSEWNVETLDYATGADTARYTIANAAQELRTKLTDPGLRFNDQTQVIFVAHSMGGLVVQSLLLDRDFQRKLLGKNLGVVLVATPSQGSPLANLAKAFSGFFANRQLEELGIDAPSLLSLQDNFHDLCRAEESMRHWRLGGVELMETDETMVGKVPVGLVVPPQSAGRYFRRVVRIPNVDHLEIAHGGPNSRVHDELKRFLHEEFYSDDDKIKQQNVVLLSMLNRKAALARRISEQQQQLVGTPGLFNAIGPVSAELTEWKLINDLFLPHLEKSELIRGQELKNSDFAYLDDNSGETILTVYNTGIYGSPEHFAKSEKDTFSGIYRLNEGNAKGQLPELSSRLANKYVLPNDRTGRIQNPGMQHFMSVPVFEENLKIDSSEVFLGCRVGWTDAGDWRGVGYLEPEVFQDMDENGRVNTKIRVMAATFGNSMPKAEHKFITRSFRVFCYVARR